MKVFIKRLNTGRVIDLYSNIGGMSLGFKAAGFRYVTGMDKDPLAVKIYRERVGTCWLGEINEFSHPPWAADVVMADIPWKKMSSRKLKTEDVIPELEVFSTFKIAVEAQALAVVFSLIPWGETSVFDLKTKKFGVLKFIVEMAENAGYHVSVALIDGVDFGLPQYRKRVICVAFKTAALLRKFTWPHPTHNGKKRKLDPVRVCDVLDIDYPHPSPTVTSSEFKSCWKGDQGGSSSARRASERIAGYMGRAKWGERNVCLEAAELAVLQGLPSWDWSKIPKRHSLPLIGRAFPPVVAKAIGSSIYTALYGKNVGSVPGGVAG